MAAIGPSFLAAIYAIYYGMNIISLYLNLQQKNIKIKRGRRRDTRYDIFETNPKFTLFLETPNYEHMKILIKKYPWGDGTLPLFGIVRKEIDDKFKHHYEFEQ